MKKSCIQACLFLCIILNSCDSEKDHLVNPSVKYVSLSGHVLDSFNQWPVKEVIVTVYSNVDFSKLARVKTDSNGFFIIENLPPGNHNIILQKEYYETKSFHTDILKDLVISEYLEHNIFYMVTDSLKYHLNSEGIIYLNNKFKVATYALYCANYQFTVEKFENGLWKTAVVYLCPGFLGSITIKFDPGTINTESLFTREKGIFRYWLYYSFSDEFNRNTNIVIYSNEYEVY